MTTLPKSVQTQLPTSVIRKLSELDETVQIAFRDEYLKRRRSSLVGFLLLNAGLHYAYVGRIWLAVLFILTFGGCGLWWFIDLFRVWGLVREKNGSIAIGVLRDIQILR